MGYRFLQGDRFFVDIQEPQLLLAPLIGLLEASWIWLNGSVDGILIYLRSVTCIIHVGAAIFIYYTLRMYLKNLSAFLCAVFFYFYHFRYINLTDYTFLFCTASVMCMCLYLHYIWAKYKLLNIFLAGISFSVMCLCFPSTVVLFPFFMLLYVKRTGIVNAGLLLVVCCAAAFLECLILLHNVSAMDAYAAIKQVIGGSTYMKNATPKADKFLLLTLSLLSFVLRKCGHFDRFNSSELQPILQNFCGIISYAILLCGLSMLAVSEFIRLEYFNKNGYFYILLFGAVKFYLKKQPEWIRGMFIWGIAGDLLVSYMTKYSTAFVYALPALMAVVILIVQDLEQCTKKKVRIVPAAALCLLLCVEVFNDILMISNNNHNGDTIFNQELTFVREGPAAGAVARLVDHQKYCEIYSWIQSNIHAPVKVCYFGKNVLLYLMSPDIHAAVPQLFMDYSSESVLGEYYTSHHDKTPDLVILDISPTTKRHIMTEEACIFKNYRNIYQSLNYQILSK